MNKSKNALSKKDKKRILIYILIILFSIILMVISVIFGMKKYKNEKEEKIRYQKLRKSVESKYGRNAYIEKRNIEENEVYKQDYNLNAELQFEKPKVGDDIFEIKIKGFSPLKFKIFTPNTPTLAMDLEKAVKDKKIIGKKIAFNFANPCITIDKFGEDKIWSINSKKNLDLKLVPFSGSLIVKTNKKVGDENYGSEINIVAFPEDETNLLKKAKFPKQLINLSKKYNGSLLENYSKTSVIGQLYEGRDALKKISEEVYKESSKKTVKDEDKLIVEDVKFYQY